MLRVEDKIQIHRKYQIQGIKQNHFFKFMKIDLLKKVKQFEVTVETSIAHDHEKQ